MTVVQFNLLVGEEKTLTPLQARIVQSKRKLKYWESIDSDEARKRAEILRRFLADPSRNPKDIIKEVDPDLNKKDSNN